MFNNSVHTQKLQQKTLNMCLAIPQVMASRIWKIMTSPLNSSSQQKEIYTMVSEKQDAFMMSISDVNSQIISSQITLMNEWMHNCQNFMSGNYQAFNNFDKHIDRETIKVMDKGISPYAKTVKYNEKRLTQ